MTTKNHEITLEQAIDLTTRFRNNRPPAFPLYETFHVESIRTLINPVACHFLRVYFGMKENSEVVVILVAADAAEQDLLPADSSNGTIIDTDENVIIEDGYRCPQYCPSESALSGK